METKEEKKSIKERKEREGKKISGKEKKTKIWECKDEIKIEKGKTGRRWRESQNKKNIRKGRRKK